MLPDDNVKIIVVKPASGLNISNALLSKAYGHSKRAARILI